MQRPTGFYWKTARALIIYSLRWYLDLVNLLASFISPVICRTVKQTGMTELNPTIEWVIWNSMEMGTFRGYISKESCSGESICLKCRYSGLNEGELIWIKKWTGHNLRLPPMKN